MRDLWGIAEHLQLLFQRMNELSAQNSETTICNDYLLWKICLDDHVEYDRLCGSEIELNDFIAHCLVVGVFTKIFIGIPVKQRILCVEGKIADACNCYFCWKLKWLKLPALLRLFEGLVLTTWNLDV